MIRAEYSEIEKRQSMDGAARMFIMGITIFGCLQVRCKSCSGEVILGINHPSNEDIYLSGPLCRSQEVEARRVCEILFVYAPQAYK